MTAAMIPLEYQGVVPAERRAPLGLLALVIGAVAVGFAIQLQDGEYTPLALTLTTLALAACVVAIVRPLALVKHLSATRGVELLLTGAIGLQLLALALTWPGVDLPQDGRFQLAPFFAGMLAVALLVARILFSELRTSERIWFPLLLLSFLLLAGWMVFSSPKPFIDVWYFQQDGADALLSGKNPYSITFPDIYHSTEPGRQQVYGPGLVENGRTKFGFPYPPVSLLLATAGYAVAGDHRYAQALAVTLAGLFIGYSRRSRIAMLAAAVLLFTPRVFFVLGRGWTEPFGVMLLAATIFCASRRSRLLPLALGLFLATKQYLIVAVPLTFFLLPSGWRWRDWAWLLVKSAIVAAAVTLPLALWNWHEFWRSTVTVQELAPFRWDSLSYLVFYGKARANFHALDFPIWLVSRNLTVTDAPTAVIWSTLAAGAMLVLSLRRSPRTPAGFAASLALVSLAFFSFNKQAFCNYYFFVIGSICCAIAAWEAQIQPLVHSPGAGAHP